MSDMMSDMFLCLLVVAPNFSPSGGFMPLMPCCNESFLDSHEAYAPGFCGW